MALGGGGAKGLCHIAFLRALDEMGLKPSIIAGTSIGAIVGGFYAGGTSAAQMEHDLGKVGFKDIYKMVDFSLFSTSALLRGKGVEDFLSKNIPARQFAELEIPLKVVATDFWGRQEVIFSSGELIPAIRASMAMPAIFEPVVMGDRVLIDGGAVNPLPYDIIRKDCDILVAIDVSGEKTRRGNDSVPDMLESILSTFQIMQASIVESKKRISRPDIYIKPLLKDIRVLDFYRYEEIIKDVRNDVEIFKYKLERLL